MMQHPVHIAIFEKHPDPMWIYDLETLRFLAVNTAAVKAYGYSSAEFLDMTLQDLRSATTGPALLEAAGKFLRADLSDPETGIWQHRTKSGAILHVDIRLNRVEWDGRPANLAAARDVSFLEALAQEREALIEQERGAREQAEALAQHFQFLFESAPGKYLVLAPDTFQMLAASDAFLAGVQMPRRDVIGAMLFDVFNENPDDPDADGQRNLRASLERVRATGLPDIMAVQRYVLRLPESAGGGYQARYWNPVNTPITGRSGKMDFIILRFEDVTDLMHDFGAEPDSSAAGPVIGVIAGPNAQLQLDVVLRSREMKQINDTLRRKETWLRNTERIAKIGYWELNLQTNALSWSDQVYQIFGLPVDRAEGTFRDILDRIHPSDRDRYVANRKAAIASGARFESVHRILLPDGTLRHVRELGGSTDGASGPVFSGVIQDITDIQTKVEKANAAARLLSMAGKVAAFGGWRITMADKVVAWSEQITEIHEMPPGFSPSVTGGYNFFAPEFRALSEQLLQDCMALGTSYDQIMQIVTARGNRVWVRCIGEAERDTTGQIVAINGAMQAISELIEAQNRSRELTEQMQQTFEAISDGFMMLDHGWTITFLNSKAAGIIGRDKAELIGKRLTEAFPGADNGPLYEAYADAMDRRQNTFLTAFDPAIGKWIKVSAYSTAKGISIYFNDMTEQRDQQNQLALLEAAVARLNDMVVITEAEPQDAPFGPRIIYANDAFYRRTGYSPEEVIGKTPRILQGPKTQRSELARIREAMRTWQPVRTEVINYAKDGSEFWLELDIVPITDASGLFTHWVSVERDVTRRKAAEAALLISEERFRMVARATNDVLWDWDIATDKVWWNDSMQAVFGYGRDMTIATFANWLNCIHPKDSVRVTGSLREALDGDAMIWSCEYELRRADGSFASIADRGFILRDDAGVAVRVVGSMRDLSEQRKMESALREAYKLDAIGNLTGGIAHDFNNLLTIILGTSDLLEGMLTDMPAAQQMVATTIAAAERGAALTSRLLAFARQIPLEPRPVDVNDVLVRAKPLLLQALDAQVDLHITTTGDIWQAMVDPGQLVDAVLNLVINSRDAMPDGGWVMIETSNALMERRDSLGVTGIENGEYVLVSVTDSGQGMTPEVISRAFEPFYTTKGGAHGSGLGLSMVYGFMKQSRGHARIYSELGIGTTIKLYLPRTLDLVTRAEEIANQDTPTGTGEHILMVEDDSELRQLAEGQLRSLGYRVTAASNGSEALAALENISDFDLLFTDVVMPGDLNGRELAQTALRLHPRLKVLFTSGYTRNTIMNNRRLDPDVVLLTKPYRRADLAARIHDSLAADTACSSDGSPD